MLSMPLVNFERVISSHRQGAARAEAAREHPAAAGVAMLEIDYGR
jgi:hypothetical protein